MTVLTSVARRAMPAAAGLAEFAGRLAARAHESGRGAAGFACVVAGVAAEWSIPRAAIVAGVMLCLNDAVRGWIERADARKAGDDL